MNRSIKIAKNWGCVMLLSLAVLTSCSKNDEEPPVIPETPETPDLSITLDEIIGGWEGEGYKWDLDNGKSACYLMTEDGNDYALDENGDYITVTVREYCEQYAKDYNADPKNEIKGTPYDFADHVYEGSYMFTNINVMKNKITVYLGQRIPDAGVMSVLNVTGTYTYEQVTKEKGVLTVDDQATKDDPRTLKIDVTKDAEGRVNFRYSDFDIYLTPTYDQTKKYYVYAPTIFYCRPGEPYAPAE